MTQFLIFFINKYAQGVGLAHHRDTMALWLLFCSGSSVGAEGPKRWDWKGCLCRSCTSQIFELPLLSGFLGIVFAMGFFPAVQSLS